MEPCQAAAILPQVICGTILCEAAGRWPVPVSRVAHKLSITLVLLALGWSELESQDMWIGLFWMLLDRRDESLASGIEIKPHPTKHVFGVGEAEFLYASIKRAESEELRSDVTLFVIQEES